MLTACEQDKGGPVFGSTAVGHTGLLTACDQDQDEIGSVLILLASCQQTCMAYTTSVCTVTNSC